MKNSTQNAPKCAILHSKVKKIRPFLLWGRGNTPLPWRSTVTPQHIPDPPQKERREGGKGKGKKGVDDPECLKCVDDHDCKFKVALACWNVL